MSKHQDFPDELYFLRKIVETPDLRIKSVWWLKTDFDANTWLCDFGREPFSISFDVHLDDGSCLTEDRHRTLLNSFKTWLCLQCHPDVNRGRITGAAATFHSVSRVFRLIDYFVINSNLYSLSETGLSTLTSSDFRGILETIASSNRTTSSIYKWERRVVEYLREGVASISPQAIQIALLERPTLAIVACRSDDSGLNVDNNELVQFRAFLWSTGLYRTRGRRNSNYRYQPDMSALVRSIYPNTIWAHRSGFEVPEELCFDPLERYGNEYEGVPVRTGIGPILDERQLNEWRSALLSLRLLPATPNPLPPHAFDGISNSGWMDSLNLRPSGRFASLPQSAVFQLLRKSLEFALDMGEELVDSYVALARAANEKGLSIAKYSNEYGLREIVGPKLRDIGVKRWHLAQHMSLQEGNPARGAEYRATSKEFFQRFRSNEGLYELIIVLVGAIQICVGTLMARRQGELLDLVAGRCLDRTKRYLIFENRKSGILERREELLRPIPPIAARLIAMLERMQAELVADGSIPAMTVVFATPHRANSSFAVTHMSFNNTFNRTCDYFQSPLDRKSRRFYVRQHQLRRFFATLFFWGGTFGGADTLRWFLGHTDVEHLYHYITESTPGAVLRWAKAEYAADALEQGEHNDTLGVLVETRFNLTNYTLLDSDELRDYIDELLFEGKVTVEPEFFTSPSGKTYQIFVKVRHENAN